MSLFIFTKIILLLLFYFIFFFFLKSCSGMFRYVPEFNVPGCSGMFHVPNFIDAPFDRPNLFICLQRGLNFQKKKLKNTSYRIVS